MKVEGRRRKVKRQKYSIFNVQFSIFKDVPNSETCLRIEHWALNIENFISLSL
jgi:hypothetical protein